MVELLVTHGAVVGGTDDGAEVDEVADAAEWAHTHPRLVEVVVLLRPLVW
jgi:hypothetical protein